MLPANKDYRVPPISPLQVIIELGLIILAAIYVTSGFINFDPSQRIFGFEMEYVTGNHYVAAETLRTQGYIPLWQPYVSTGEPIIDGWLSDVLNPFSSGPSYLFGGNTGLKLGIVVAAIVAGLGGWALGRVLGFGSLARIVLAFLCLGKGNLYSMISVGGYYQLLFDQAFFPWIAAGIISLFWLPHRRWPIVLTALSITLLFFAGAVWFMLPTLMVLGMVALVHFPSRLRKRDRLATAALWLAKVTQFIDFVGFRRLIYAAFLTIMLSSATLLPIAINYNNLPKQKLQGDQFLDLGVSIDQFLNPYLGKHAELNNVVRTESFNFTLPVWFGVVLLVLTIPLIIFYRQAAPKLWRIYIIGWVVVIFFVLWTAGLNPAIQVLDNLNPVFAQFKHQWRTLAVAGFWLSVLIAIHVEGLWVTFARSDAWQTRLAGIKLHLLQGADVRRLVAITLILVCGYASFQVAASWKTIQPLESQTNLEGPCVTWLRQTNPSEFMSMWTGRYIHVWDYINNHIRHWNISSDFYPVTPLAPTLLTDFTLIHSPPQYALIYGGELDYAELLGFKPDPPPYTIDAGDHCNLGKVMYNPNTFSYAYSVPLDVIQASANTILPTATTSINATNYIHGADYIALVVDSDPKGPRVVTLQESAYPGWQVQVNGQAAKLESVGGQLGVVLPPGQGRNQILFQYLPPLWLLGSKITLFGCLLCIAFLLRVERLVPHVIVDRMRGYNVRISTIVKQRLNKTWQKSVVLLTNEHAFDPDFIDPPVNPLLMLSPGNQEELSTSKRTIEAPITPLNETTNSSDHVE